MSENEKKILDLSVSMPTEQEPPADIWGDDALGRKKFADDLTRIVKNAAEHKSFTLSLHGDWGTGKTYLLQRWHKQLQLQKKEGKSKKHPQVIYFNAWEDDFQADPLTAIVGQLWKEIKEGDFAEIGESLKSLVGNLGEKALGVVGGKKKDFQSTAERTVDDYLAVREKLDGFKKRLETLAAKVNEDTEFPLVFIVDELDRCKPTFAIEVLERVKHLFNAPNIIFVFGVNKTELQKSIQSAYGSINAEDYLRRFFDISLTLPAADASAYCEHLLKQNDLEEALNHMEEFRSFYGGSGWKSATSRLPGHLVGYMGLSLRKIEHIVRLLRYAAKARIDSDRVVAGEAWSIFILAILKIKKPDLYAEFIGGKCRCAKVVDYFLDMLPDPFGKAKHAALFVESAIYRLAQGDEKSKIIEALELLRNGKSLDDSSIAGFLAKRTEESDNRFGAEKIDNGDDVDLRKVAAALLDLADDSRR